MSKWLFLELDVFHKHETEGINTHTIVSQIMCQNDTSNTNLQTVHWNLLWKQPVTVNSLKHEVHNIIV